MRRRGFQPYTGERGLTRAERSMGNTREDRELIASVNAVPRGKRYRLDMEAVSAGEAPKITDTSKTK